MPDSWLQLGQKVPLGIVRGSENITCFATVPTLPGKTGLPASHRAGFQFVFYNE
jgi:hypothetical protein